MVLLKLNWAKFFKNPPVILPLFQTFNMLLLLFCSLPNYCTFLLLNLANKSIWAFELIFWLPKRRVKALKYLTTHAQPRSQHHASPFSVSKIESKEREGNLSAHNGPSLWIKHRLRTGLLWYPGRDFFAVNLFIWISSASLMPGYDYVNGDAEYLNSPTNPL